MAADRLNLLDEGPTPKREKLDPALTKVGIKALAFMLGLALASLKLNSMTSRWVADANALDKEKKELQEKIAQISKPPDEKANTDQARIFTIQEIVSKRIRWSEVLKELSLITPADVWLVNLKSQIGDDGERTMALTGETGQRAQIAEFFSALEKSYSFRHVMFKTSEKLADFSPALYRFEFESKIPKEPLKGVVAK